MAVFKMQLNPFAECRQLKWGLLRCPPFLFLLMGIITIISMIATYMLASRYTEQPEIAALIVIFETVLFLILGNIIISGFNRIAETNRIKSEFISIISHQLRSPLSIFKWTLDVLERDIKKIDPNPGESENFLKTLHTTTEKMISLVNSLLEVSRIEAETFKLRKEPVSLEEISRQIIGEFLRYAEASNLVISTEFEAGLPDIFVDKDRIVMVMQNLIDNAIRYTGRAGKIIIRIEQSGENLKWSIEDQGIGIPADQQKFIFQKFFRAENLKQSSSDGQTRGSGIGLYIAHEIVQASGGSIGFTSTEGQGTLFWFTVPIKIK